MAGHQGSALIFILVIVVFGLTVAVGGPCPRCPSGLSLRVAGAAAGAALGVGSTGSFGVSQRARIGGRTRSFYR